MSLGDMEDGEKEICLDEKYKPKYPCLVYSFGKSIKGKNIPKGIHFHLTGLSDKNITKAKGWKMQTLSSIRKLLNHTDRALDVLKIDTEGGEWTALPEIFQSGELKYAKQLCIEMHFDKTYPRLPLFSNSGYD